jgi:hypothetical protein
MLPLQIAPLSVTSPEVAEDKLTSGVSSGSIASLADRMSPTGRGKNRAKYVDGEGNRVNGELLRVRARRAAVMRLSSSAVVLRRWRRMRVSSTVLLQLLELLLLLLLLLQ